MTDWITGDDGDRIFTHEGWKVVIGTFDDDEGSLGIWVAHPLDPDLYVVTSRGLKIFTKVAASWADTVTLPFPVLAAIVEAREIVSTWGRG